MKNIGGSALELSRSFGDIFVSISVAKCTVMTLSDLVCSVCSRSTAQGPISSTKSRRSCSQTDWNWKRICRDWWVTRIHPILSSTSSRLNFTLLQFIPILPQLVPILIRFDADLTWFHPKLTRFYLNLSPIYANFTRVHPNFTRFHPNFTRFYPNLTRFHPNLTWFHQKSRKIDSVGSVEFEWTDE